jgi:5-oxoprolinase (ATP-hydrolysing) subunit A
VDLNSDLGEGFGRWSLGDDEALLGIVTSANVACGFHAGDPSIMRRVCTAAAERGVAVGAQVGYPDLAGFGRRFLDIDPTELTDAVTYQIGALDAFARQAGSRVAYVKPHGALYNAIVHHEAQAAAVVAAVRPWGVPVLGLPGSAVLRLAQVDGVGVVTEAFADRAYRADGSLVPRSEPGAVVHDPADVCARVIRMATTGEVLAIDGSVVRVDAASLCVHGDTPGAVDLAAAVRAALESAGVTITAFARP